MSEFVDTRNGAIFSDDRTYRYQLWREWNTKKPRIVFVLLNPSTADETTNDPTIRRCINYSNDWGYGKLTVVNLFAYRATEPSEMKQAPDPVGPDNNRHIKTVCDDADKVIVAWGAHGSHMNRAREIGFLLDMETFCFDTTQDGHPVHPLYQPRDQDLGIWAVSAIL